MPTIWVDNKAEQWLDDQCKNGESYSDVVKRLSERRDIAMLVEQCIENADETEGSKR